MREKLNSNPIAQVALIGALLVAVGFFALSTMGGKEEEESGSAETTSSVATAAITLDEATEGTAEASTTTAPLPSTADLPPPPPAVSKAYEAGDTVVLLFVREGGIDDGIVKAATDRLRAFSDVSTFIVPAGRISHYASIAGGVSVDRVPALVVVRPKRVAGNIPAASVLYGFQSPDSVEQAVIDAGYKGRTLDYHP
jgi:hypothetical protein